MRTKAYVLFFLYFPSLAFVLTTLTISSLRFLKYLFEPDDYSVVLANVDA